MDIIKYQIYLDFLNSCKNKVYTSSEALHQHHIIPKFMDVENAYKDYTIELNVEDHANAHLLLSDCFDDLSREKIGNLRSYILISTWSISDKELLYNAYECMRGDGNPAKLEENRIKISNGLKAFFEKNGHNFKHKTYEEIYGIDADIQKAKRSKSSRTKEEYLESGKKASLKLKGRKVHNSVPVIIDGVEYDSLTHASKVLKITRHKLKKYKI